LQQSRDCCALRRGRGRQCDRERIAAQYHDQYQPPNRALTVSFGAEKLGDVTHRRILSLDLPAFGAHGGALGFQVRQGLALALAPYGKLLAGSAQSLDRR
jgi:hypothetical protein